MSHADYSSSLSSSSSSCSSSSCSSTSEDIRKTRQISLQEEIHRSNRKLSALGVGADLLEAKHQEQSQQLNKMREQVQLLLDQHLSPDKNGIFIEVPDEPQALLSVMATYPRSYCNIKI